jgi:hypothetical protein
MFDNRIEKMNPGQVITDARLPDMIEQMGKSIASAQLAMDSTGVKIGTMLGESKVNFKDANGNSVERSLLELCFSPTNAGVLMSLKDKALSFAFQKIIGQLQNSGTNQSPSQGSNSSSIDNQMENLFSQLAEKGGLNPAVMEEKIGGKLDGMMDQMAGPISEMAEKALNEKMEEESNR